MINDLKVTKGTVVRTVMTVTVILNLVLKAFGGIKAINIDQNDVSAIIENLVSIGVIILGFWKNNSFTDKAKAADFYLAKLRNFDTDDSDTVFDEEG